jgi:hypothetical protein
MELVKRGDEERKEGESSDLRFQEMEKMKWMSALAPFKPLTLMTIPIMPFFLPLTSSQNP